MASSGRSPFDLRLVRWIAAGLVLGLAIAGLIRVLVTLGGAGAPRTSLFVVAEFPAPDASAPGTGRIEVDFSQPARLSSVVDHWSLRPDTPGTFRSDGDRIVFTPNEPFQVGETVRVMIGAGVMSDDGAFQTQAGLDWSFTIRQPQVVFLAPSQAPHGLWQVAPGDSSARQSLLPAGEDISGFSVAPGGDSLALVIGNSAGGHDLWTLNLNTGERVRRASCGQDDCLNPIWLPDRNHLAYTRVAPVGTSTVWVLPLSGGEPTRLLGDSDLQAEDPVWSPDGGKVAFDDLTAQAMRIHDFEYGHDLSFHTLNGLVGSWSPDGTHIVANVLDISQDPPLGKLYVIDAGSGDASPIIVQGLIDFGDPVWSPTGDWIAVSARRPASGLDRGIWLVRPDGSDLTRVADDPGTILGGPVWDPWGESLLFQGVPSDSLDAAPDVFIWKAGDGEAKKLAQDAFSPAWLP
jgi:Tol biopolymer transport system component